MLSIGEVYLVVTSPEVPYLSVIINLLNPSVKVVRDLDEDFKEHENYLPPLDDAIERVNQSQFEVMMESGITLDEVTEEGLVPEKVMTAISNNKLIFQLAGTIIIRI